MNRSICYRQKLIRNWNTFFSCRHEVADKTGKHGITEARTDRQYAILSLAGSQNLCQTIRIMEVIELFQVRFEDKCTQTASQMGKFTWWHVISIEGSVDDMSWLCMLSHDISLSQNCLNVVEAFLNVTKDHHVQSLKPSKMFKKKHGDFWWNFMNNHDMHNLIERGLSLGRPVKTNFWRCTLSLFSHLIHSQNMSKTKILNLSIDAPRMHLRWENLHDDMLFSHLGLSLQAYDVLISYLIHGPYVKNKILKLCHIV